MKIETEIRTILTVTLTDDETEILNDACEILGKLRRMLGEDKTLMSLSTGEIIQTNELPYIRGILSGIADNVMWTELS